MKHTIVSTWKSLVTWLEHGDLVLLIILVSAVHYADILKAKDDFIVAIAIGILVDLGCYRWVRAASRYQGDSKRERATRWALAIGMSGITFMYHQRFYGDPWLSVPLPLLVISLAWLAEVDLRTGKRKGTKAETQASEAISQPVAATAHVCETCKAVYANRYALSAHQRAHSKNGREKERVEIK